MHEPKASHIAIPNIDAIPRDYLGESSSFLGLKLWLNSIYLKILLNLILSLSSGPIRLNSLNVDEDNER